MGQSGRLVIVTIDSRVFGVDQLLFGPYWAQQPLSSLSALERGLVPIMSHCRPVIAPIEPKQLLQCQT